jgi:hypothetical protein
MRFSLKKRFSSLRAVSVWFVAFGVFVARHGSLDWTSLDLPLPINLQKSFWRAAQDTEGLILYET